MCTAATYATRDNYFGRTFDWEVSYGEMIAFTPRNYPLNFRKMPALEKHYAMLGIAVVVEDYPLYYDAINEVGLGMAGATSAMGYPYLRFGDESWKDYTIEFTAGCTLG